MLQVFRKKPYILNILILAAIPVITLIEWTHIDILSYYGGLKNSPSWGFMTIFLYEPMKIMVVLFSIVKIFLKTKHIKEFVTNIVTVLLSILIFVMCWILPFKFNPPGAVYFLKGYKTWVNKNVDIIDIQAWFLSGQADKYLNKTYRYEFPDDLPDFMTNFEPKFIIFNDRETERGKCIEFGWGGGMESWGFVVGPPTMESQQEGRIESHSSYLEFRRQIKPGVYIYDGG
jgi:hypothetical protein